MKCRSADLSLHDGTGDTYSPRAESKISIQQAQLIGRASAKTVTDSTIFSLRSRDADEYGCCSGDMQHSSGTLESSPYMGTNRPVTHLV